MLVYAKDSCNLPGNVTSAKFGGYLRLPEPVGVGILYVSQHRYSMYLAHSAYLSPENTRPPRRRIANPLLAESSTGHGASSNSRTSVASSSKSLLIKRRNWADDWAMLER